MEIMTHTLDFSIYIKNYCEPARFEPFCRECGNYGRCWTCPPFEKKDLPDFSRFQKILLIACRIELGEGDVTEIIADRRKDLERHLLDIEAQTGGLAFGFTGFCPYCEKCTREEGNECRFPEKARPALEAYGFDLCRTMEDFFGERLQWTSGDEKRKSVTIIGGLAHNAEKSPVFKI